MHPERSAGASVIAIGIGFRQGRVKDILSFFQGLGRHHDGRCDQIRRCSEAQFVISEANEHESFGFRINAEPLQCLLFRLS
jgi:hypothetical protein